MRRPSSVTAALVGLGIIAGCAAAPESPKPTTSAAAPAPATAPAAGGGVPYQDDAKLGGRAWVAPGFDPKAYDAVYVVPPVAEVPKLNPDGVESLEWAKGFLRDEIARAFRAANVFPAVVTSESDIKPGSRAVRLEQTIVEYEKGGGGARFFAGVFGAGQPVLKVRGRLTAGGADSPLFLYEARRSGDSGSARVFGGYRGDRDIQMEDIKDLADDLADHLVRALKR